MGIPTEPIGSIPRPLALIEALARGDGDDPALEALYEQATRDTIGFRIPFAAGHVRRMPRLTGGPFRYKRTADSFIDVALRYARSPVKQAVISPSALSLMYPAQGLPEYSRDEFIDDLLREHETEVRRCLQKGAHSVQIDFTEGRLALKIDPSGQLLASFVDLNNLALARFSAADRARIGVHTCPGGDRDSTHSAQVDYAQLLPSLFQLRVGNFFVSLAGERDRRRVLEIIREHLKPEQRVFVGVIASIDPRVETPEEVKQRILEADTAFAKIRARVLGTEAAARELRAG